MSRIKIVFFDIDGTLLNIGAERITEKTLEALKGLKAQGIKICIATGRPVATLPTFEGVVFDAYIAFNGSLCYDQEGVILSTPLPGEDVSKIIGNAKKMGRAVSVATKTCIAANGSDTDLADYFALANVDVPVAENFEEICQEEVYQMMIGCQEGDREALLSGVEGARITAWWDRAVDVIPITGGKGTAIKKVLAHYHLDPTEAMAFGDGNNDIEMLQSVGISVAMGNASPRLKAVAGDICGPVSEDGVYHYCAEHGLIY